MPKSFPRTDEELTLIYTRHGRTVYRVCLAYMRTPADAEDAVQETFFRLIRRAPVLESEEHEKAWLIRTASNVCKTALRRRKRAWESAEALSDPQSPDAAEAHAVLRAVSELAERYKAAVYLYYYEGRSGAETAAILKKPHSTVRNHLREARALLKEKLGDDILEE